MDIFQDDNVKILQAQTVKEWLGGAWRIIFTHELPSFSPEIQFIESLESVELLYCQYKIMTKRWRTSRCK